LLTTSPNTAIEKGTRSLARISSTLRTFIKYQQSHGKLAEVNLSDILRPQYTPQADNPSAYLNIDQIRMVLDIPSQPARERYKTPPLIGYRNKTIFELMFGAKMKAREVLSLDRDSIKRSSSLIVHGPKSRIVTPTPRAMQSLAEYLGATNRYTQSNDAIFMPTRGGTDGQTNDRLSYSYLASTTKTYGKRLGLDHSDILQSLTKGLDNHTQILANDPVLYDEMINGHRSHH